MNITQRLQSIRGFMPRAYRNLAKQKAVLVAAGIFFVATASFMWPMFTHLSTYSGGGDHMFNAWTLARNHHCILQQNCEDYTDGNIFFPHDDTMLYSETQFSAGLLTLPFFLINQSPLFATNVWYLLSIFFAGLFMYLLARYLSKGNEPVSILAGLLFAFAPTKITSWDHLQNLSIFYLPLIVLLLLKYRDTGSRKYLVGFGVSCSLLFLASWYQMVFGLVVIGLFILYVLVTGQRARTLWLVGATALAILTTLPLAKEYMRFSKENKATFSIADQVKYSSSVDDYLLPYEGTPLGALYYELRPDIQRNTHNPDNFSYTGITLYAILAFSLMELYRRRKIAKHKAQRRLTILLTAVLAAGFVISLGPLLKIGHRFIFKIDSFDIAFPAPYLLVDKLLPQLSFMRALGRASVIVLFALCCLLAIFAIRLNQVRAIKKRYALTALLIVIISLDLLPFKLLTAPFQPTPAQVISYEVPPVYKYIKNRPAIDDLVVIRTKKDYPKVSLPTAIPEDILWAGYHNKDIYNGYSGYYPPDYFPTLQDFVDFNADDVSQMKKLGLKYVLLDKKLTDSNSGLKQSLTSLSSGKPYEDNRHILFKL